MSFRIPFTSGDKRVVRIAVHEGLLIAVVYVVVSLVLSVITDIGHRADLSFYGTVAQVIPVFLLGFMVEIRSRLDRSVTSADSVLAEHEQMLEEVSELVEEAGAAGHPRHAEADAELRKVEDHITGLRAEFRDLARGVGGIVRGYVIVAVPGEAACLWALAAGHGSDFALSLGAMSLVGMVALYGRSLRSAYSDFEE